MKFIVDAQLPRRLAQQLTAAGHDAIHTLDLPARNQTQDRDITSIASREGRVVVTKDKDFVDSFLLQGLPPKLFLISTGNISNDALSVLVADNLKTLESSLMENLFVELSATAITIHA